MNTYEKVIKENKHNTIDDMFKSNIQYDILNTSYQNFLIVLRNSSWINRTGYKIVDRVEDIYDRGTEVNIKPIESTHKGKVLELFETSHDKPTGYSSYVIGLTTAEYIKLRKFFNVGDLQKVDRFIKRTIDNYGDGCIMDLS